MKERFLLRMAWFPAGVLLLAVLCPVVVRFFHKPYSDKIINRDFMPQVLKTIEGDDLCCSIYCHDCTAVLPANETKTLRKFLDYFFQNANVEFYGPITATIAPFYNIDYYEETDQHHPRVAIRVYPGEHMMEIRFSKQVLTCSIQKQDLIQLVSVIMVLCPSSDILPVIESIHEHDG